MTAESLAARRAEFEAHVWNHADDAFQQDFDLRRPLNEKELEALHAVAAAVCAGSDDEDLGEVIGALLNEDPTLMLTFLQTVGLTRTKIVTDLRAALATTGVPVPGDPKRLHRAKNVWPSAVEYLATRLRRVLQPLCRAGDIADSVFEALNQATYPGWIRQERAKRQGHEAEFRLANVFASCGIPFEPAEKADNPLCRDATLDGISFDLVLPDTNRPLV